VKLRFPMISVSRQGLTSMLTSWIWYGVRWGWGLSMGMGIVDGGRDRVKTFPAGVFPLTV
jgi:hypothetical protein